MTEEATDGVLLDLAASQLYDSGDDPIPLDMHSACAVGNYKCVQEWIDSGVNLDAKNRAGWTALMYASYVGHDTIVNLLLDAGVDPSCSSPTLLSPLMVAAGCGNESVCYFLIQAGAGVDSQDCNGFTALVHAVRQGHQTVVQLLLEAGADMELQDKDNEYTALMFGAIEGDEIIVDVLLACGADLWAKDKMGHNARYLAFSRHHVRTVTHLDNALYMHRLDSETPTNVTSNEDFFYEEDSQDSYEDNSDLFSGAKEMEAYQQSVAVKKSIQFNLGRRAGPRWSLPHQYIADRRLSKSDTTMLGIKRNPMRTAMSMPEKPLPPIEAMSSPEPGEEDKVEDFLAGLGLHKYIEVLANHEIDFQTLINFTDEDLKRVGITLMGPRRKITQAISELKEMGMVKESGNSKRNDRRNSWGEEEEAERTLTKSSRPPLEKQSSLNTTEAYREARRKITMLEEQLGREHQLRKTANSFLLDLQVSRREAVTRVSAMIDMQKDINKHCNAVKVTHEKLSVELEGLRSLSDPRHLKRIYSELVALKSKMGMELEALSRSIDSEAENVNTLSFLLKANS